MQRLQAVEGLEIVVEPQEGFRPDGCVGPCASRLPGSRSFVRNRHFPSKNPFRSAAREVVNLNVSGGKRDRPPGPGFLSRYHRSATESSNRSAAPTGHAVAPAGE